jgi:F0F1-type ATP synthase assembly protein I
VSNGRTGKSERSFLISAARYTAIAMTLPVGTFVGYAIGYQLDIWAHTRFFKIVFLLLGIGAGFLQLIRQLLRDMKDK